MIHFKGGNCFKTVLLPSENRSIIKGNKFVPFRVDPFYEGTGCTG